MATLSIASGVIPATMAIKAIKSPKGFLEGLNLRTPSTNNIITGKRIPGSAKNSVLQLIYPNHDNETKNIIRKAEKASSKKEGMIFVFDLLLQTLEKIKRQRDEEQAHPHAVGRRTLKRVTEELNLEEKECRLLYIIAYSSALTEDDAPPDMRDLLQRIKRDFGLPLSDLTRVPTIWSEMHYRATWGVTYDDLLKRIQYVKSYIDLWNKKVATAERNTLDRVVKAVAAGRKKEYGPKYSSSIQPYDNEGLTGPYRNLAENWIIDTEEHKKQVEEKVEREKDEKERRRTEKFRNGYHKHRRTAAIKRDRIPPEKAKKLPSNYGRALNAGGRRRKKKTRKRRKGGSKKPHRKKKRRKSRKKIKKRRTKKRLKRKTKKINLS